MLDSNFYIIVAIICFLVSLIVNYLMDTSVETASNQENHLEQKVNEIFSLMQRSDNDKLRFNDVDAFALNANAKIDKIQEKISDISRSQSQKTQLSTHPDTSSKPNSPISNTTSHNNEASPNKQIFSTSALPPSVDINEILNKINQLIQANSDTQTIKNDLYNSFSLNVETDQQRFLRFSNNATSNNAIQYIFFNPKDNLDSNFIRQYFSINQNDTSQFEKFSKLSQYTRNGIEKGLALYKVVKKIEQEQQAKKEIEDVVKRDFQVAIAAKNNMDSKALVNEVNQILKKYDIAPTCIQMPLPSPFFLLKISDQYTILLFNPGEPITNNQYYDLPRSPKEIIKSVDALCIGRLVYVQQDQYNQNYQNQNYQNYQNQNYQNNSTYQRNSQFQSVQQNHGQPTFQPTQLGKIQYVEKSSRVIDEAKQIQRSGDSKKASLRIAQMIFAKQWLDEDTEMWNESQNQIKINSLYSQYYMLFTDETNKKIYLSPAPGSNKTKISAKAFEASNSSDNLIVGNVDDLAEVDITKLPNPQNYQLNELIEVITKTEKKGKYSYAV